MIYSRCHKDKTRKEKIMAKENKTNRDMTELQAIEKCPELTDFIMKSKIKSVRKTALILGIVACGITFVGGLFCGMNWTRTSIPNNVVQIEVSGAEKSAVNESK